MSKQTNLLSDEERKRIEQGVLLERKEREREKYRSKVEKEVYKDVTNYGEVFAFFSLVLTLVAYLALELYLSTLPLLTVGFGVWGFRKSKTIGGKGKIVSITSIVIGSVFALYDMYLFSLGFE